MSGRAASLVARAQLALSMALVGSYVALSKPLVAAIPVFALAFLRFAIAALAMLPWLRERPGAKPVSSTTHRLMFLQSFFGNFLFSIAMLEGVQRTSAAGAGVVMGALPVVVAVGAFAFLREPLSVRTLLAVALAALGIALGRAGDASAARTGGAFAGEALVFGAVCCEAIYVLIGKRIAKDISPLRVSATINLWGLALTAPFGLPQLLHLDVAAVPLPLWGLLLFYSLSASVFSVWLWMQGLRSVPASHAGVFTAALPLAATTVGVAWLGEGFGVLSALALAACVGGIVLVATPVPDADPAKHAGP